MANKFVCVRVRTQGGFNERALDRSLRRKYRMQKTKKQIVNHLLARFLHAQKAGDARGWTSAKRDGDIPAQSRRNYNYFTAKERRKKQSKSGGHKIFRA